MTTVVDEASMLASDEVHLVVDCLQISHQPLVHERDYEGEGR